MENKISKTIKKFKKIQHTRFVLTAIILLAAIIILAALNAQPSLAAFSNSPDIRVTMVNQDPDPVEPGRFVDVRFKIENLGTVATPNISLEILSEYPFTLYSPSYPVQNLGSLSGLQKGRDSVIVKYRLAVDDKALEGKNEIRVRYTLQDGTSVYPEAFNISIKSSDTLIAVDGVQLEPSEVSAGNKARLGLTLRSLTQATSENIRITLGLSGSPLSPYGESNEKIINFLKGFEASTVVFNLIASSDAKSGVYQLPLMLTWNDAYGNKFQKNLTVSAIIRNNPSYLLSVEESEPLIRGQQGKIIISLSNTGTAELRYASVELLSGDDYELLSYAKPYVGNLKSDDYETAEFKIYVNKNAGDELYLNSRISFKDEFEKPVSNDMKLKVKTYNRIQAEALGITKKEKSSLYLLIPAATIALILFILLRRRKK